MERVLCIDVGRMWIKSGVVGEKEVGEIKEVEAAKSSEELIGVIGGLVKANEGEAERWAVGLPGSLRGQRYWSEAAGYGLMGREIDLWEKLGERGIKAPAAACNDVFAAARGEALLHGEKAELLIVNIGGGLASSITEDGWPKYKVGQESGHLTYRAGGRECKCGRKGCYEAYVGFEALKEKSGAEEAAELEIKLSQEEKEEAIEALSFYLAGLISISGISQIVMTGGCYEGFYKQHLEEIKARVGNLYLKDRPAEFMNGGGRQAVMRGLYDLGQY